MVAHGKQPQENSPFILTLYILRGDGPGHRVAVQELKNPARRYNVGGSRVTRGQLHKLQTADRKTRH